MARCRWSVLFSRLFDSLQPHRADMAERLDLLVLVAVNGCVLFYYCSGGSGEKIHATASKTSNELA